MKKIIFLFLSCLTFAQINTYQKLSAFDNVIDADAWAHKARVESDGGVIYDFNALNQAIITAKQDNSYANTIIWASPIYGVKIDGSNYVSKLYSIKGATSDLTQSTGANQPLLVVNQQNGKPVIRFDGSNDFIKSPSVTLAQPATVYAGIKQVSFTDFDRVWDGYAYNTIPNYQRAASGILRAGVTSFVQWDNFPVGQHGILRVIYNTSASSIQLNNQTAVSGTVGSATPNGITIGADGSNANNGNIEIGEVRVLNISPSAAQDASIKSAINNLWRVW